MININVLFIYKYIGIKKLPFVLRLVFYSLQIIFIKLLLKCIHSYIHFLSVIKVLESDVLFCKLFNESMAILQ